MPIIHARNRHAGMTLLESMVAVLLLSVCLVPAADALRDALASSPAGEHRARELDCVSSRMEVVLAEPYQRLLSRAGDITRPSDYSSAAQEGCPAIAVYIARYGDDTTRKIGPGSSDHLLYVGAELADAGAAHRFPLATLVSR